MRCKELVQSQNHSAEGKPKPFKLNLENCKMGFESPRNDESNIFSNFFIFFKQTIVQNVEFN